MQTATAQQLKRATLSSTGSQKVQAPIRLSWTAGGACSGCGTLKAANDKGYVRQGFQQPPELDNNPAGCLITAAFNMTTINTQFCGSKFDFEFTGAQASGMTIEWNFGDGAFPATSTQTNPMGVGYLTAGSKTIILTVKKDGCKSSAAKIINIEQNQITFGGNADVTPIKCYGQKTGAISINTFGGKGFKTYSWSTGSTASAISNLSIGKYTVTVTDANQCAFTIDTVITQPTSKLSFTDVVISESCKGYNDGSISIIPNGGTAPYKFQWSTGQNTSYISDLAAGKYQIRIIDTNNCQLDTTYDLKVRCRDNVDDKLYDTFTPNGDNVNDTWIVKDILKYPKNELIIYNRWGQIVYNKMPYANEWGGLNNDGKELPTAAYYYVIRLNDDKGTIWTGSVTLVR